MRAIAIVILLTLNLATLMAQEIEHKEKIPNNQFFTKNEVAPEFPGGQNAMLAYIQKNLLSREITTDSDLIVRFTINRKGKVKKPNIIEGNNSKVEAKVMRIIKKMPRWTPAQQEGKAVPVQYVIPIILESK